MDKKQRISEKSPKAAGVRFNLKHLDFAKKQSGISSTQKVVDLLLESYWWAHHKPELASLMDEATAPASNEPISHPEAPEKPKKPRPKSKSQESSKTEPPVFNNHGTATPVDGGGYVIIYPDKAPDFHPPDELIGIDRSIWISEQKEALKNKQITKK